LWAKGNLNDLLCRTNATNCVEYGRFTLGAYPQTGPEAVCHVEIRSVIFSLDASRHHHDALTSFFKPRSFFMKKSLVALAVLAASGASFAQSNVTLYGKADIWFGQTSGSVTAGGVKVDVPSQTVLESGGIGGSRWGMKGTEDLGGGLKANFVLEQGFNIDTGAAGAAGSAFSRYAYVGASGSFGEVRLGKVGTAYDDLHGTNDNVWDSALSAIPWVGYTGTGNNELYYALPAMGGFTGAVSYALGEDKTATTSAGSIASFNAQYAQGPFMVGYAYQKETSSTNVASGVAPGFNSKLNKLLGTTNIVYVPSPAGSTEKSSLFSGSYDFGVAQLVGMYNKVDMDATAGNTATAKEYELGVNVPLSSAMMLQVGYGRSTVADPSGDVYTGKSFAAGVAYNLSKRTFVYAGFNDTKYTASQVDAEIKSDTYAIGVQHNF
jgi:predicted porin